MPAPETKIQHLLLVLLALVAYCVCVDQMANYPLITTMKSGDHKLLTATTTGNTTITLNYVQGFGAGFLNTALVGNIRVAIAIRDMQIANTSASGLIDYTCSIINITKTNFYTILTINPNGNTFSLLYYMYIGVDVGSVPHSYLLYRALSFAGQFDDTPGKTSLNSFDLSSSSISISDYANAVVAPYVMSFKMTTNT